MAACKVKESVWCFARSSGGFESWSGGFPMSSSEQKAAAAIMTIAAAAIWGTDAQRGVGNFQPMGHSAFARWNPGHTQSSLAQALLYWDRGPFRKWFRIGRQ